MCWNEVTNLVCPQITSEKKKVFKIVIKKNKNSFRSYFKLKPYKLNEYCLKINVLPVIDDWITYIHEGYHSYNPNVKIVNTKGFNYNVLKGDKILETYFGSIWYLECIIPENTIFFENQNGEIVSETIIPINAFKL